MRKVVIVGAGQLGSRHLQALKAVAEPLTIRVIDPSPIALETARKRYEEVRSEVGHEISFSTGANNEGTIDIAIIATSADVRRKVVTELLSQASVRFMVLEKLLFPIEEDYAAIDQQLKEAKTRAWVNCPMRIMPVYKRIAAQLDRRPLLYRVTGSQFGLVTNLIHYLDHVAHLTGCNSFSLDTTGVEATPIASKRPGFLELNGSVIAFFADGSLAEVTCFGAGNAPVVVEIGNECERYIVRESESKLWHSSESTNWIWIEEEAKIPYQSQITTEVIESLLATEDCGLAPYASSVKTHLSMLNALQSLMRKHSPSLTHYPFT